jgi:DNA-binding MarR family transcriptional regulator
MSSPERDPGSAWRRVLARGVVFHEAVAEQLGINATDLKCLELAVGERDISPTRLAELAGLTTGAVTGVLDRLERAGIARREADPTDRRRIVVRVDPARARDIAALYRPFAAATGAPAAGLGVEAALGAYLERASEALERETARLRVAARGGFIGDTFVAPVGRAAVGRLVFATGSARLSMNAAALGQQARVVVETAASRLTLTGAPEPGELVRARFDGPLPDVRVADGLVSVRYRRRLLGGVKSTLATLALAKSVPWSIEVEGGITDVEADLRALNLAAFELRGGANHLRLRLPRPEGTVRVAMAGGTSEARFERPAGVPVSVRVRGGASLLRLDGRQRGSESADVYIRSDGFTGAADRYELEVAGGASQVVVTST